MRSIPEYSGLPVSQTKFRQEFNIVAMKNEFQLRNAEKIIATYAAHIHKNIILLTSSRNKLKVEKRKMEAEAP